jgi:hypothetical protein
MASLVLIVALVAATLPAHGHAARVDDAFAWAGRQGRRSARRRTPGKRRALRRFVPSVAFVTCC